MSSQAAHLGNVGKMDGLADLESLRALLGEMTTIVAHKTMPRLDRTAARSSHSRRSLFSRQPTAKAVSTQAHGAINPASSPCLTTTRSSSRPGPAIGASTASPMWFVSLGLGTFASLTVPARDGVSCAARTAGSYLCHPPLPFQIPLDPAAGAALGRPDLKGIAYDTSVSAVRSGASSRDGRKRHQPGSLKAAVACDGGRL
jgi:hypothetical protein